MAPIKARWPLFAPCTTLEASQTHARAVPVQRREVVHARPRACRAIRRSLTFGHWLRRLQAQQVCAGDSLCREIFCSLALPASARARSRLGQ
jgi:hypothetical protein